MKINSTVFRLKIKEWVNRYGYAEIIAIMATYFGYFSTILVFEDSPMFAAFMGSVCEFIGFFAFIFIREFANDYRKRILKREMYGSKGFIITCIHIITEFGPAELVDTIFIRPSCIALGVYFFGPIFGILSGKLVSDIAFYIPVILSYEFRKYLYRERGK